MCTGLRRCVVFIIKSFLAYSRASGFGMAGLGFGGRQPPWQKAHCSGQYGRAPGGAEAAGAAFMMGGAAVAGGGGDRLSVLVGRTCSEARGSDILSELSAGGAGSGWVDSRLGAFVAKVRSRNRFTLYCSLHKEDIFF